MVLVHYSYDMASFEFLAIEKEESTTTERRTFGKISCKHLKDKRSESEDIIKDISYGGEYLGFVN